MKLSKRKLLFIIKEALDMSIYQPDDQFMQDMAGDGPLDIDFNDPEADRHLDNLVARNKGYKSHGDMMRQQRAVEKEKLDKSRERIRKEVGIDDPGFLPDRYGAFAVAKGEAEDALSQGDEKKFMRAFQDMSYRGGMMHATVEDYWKKEPGVQKLIDAYEDLQDDSIFNFSRSPTLKALGLTESQLRDIILENVSAQAREKYEKFKKSQQAPDLDDEFLESFLDDEGNIDYKEMERADKHFDDAIARSEGYKDHKDKRRKLGLEKIKKQYASDKKIRKQLGIENKNFSPSHYHQFTLYKKLAEDALENNQIEDFLHHVFDMQVQGKASNTSDMDAYKKEPGVKELLQAYDDVLDGRVIGRFFNVKNSPVLKALGIVENFKLVDLLE